MNAEVLGHLAYKIANAQIHQFPFPHFFVEEALPWPFYNELQKQLMSPAAYKGVEGKYKGRKFGNPDDLPLLDVFKTEDFTNIAQFPFRKYIKARCGIDFKQKTDLRLVMDEENYSIGPHTDAPWKILSYLFYLPNDYELREWGTSIYLPRNQEFRCPGGPHHNHSDFVRVATMPFIPNSLFAFFKTDFSFHGVEPITIPCRRDLLLWNLYDVGLGK